jgi:hypothetical protein
VRRAVWVLVAFVAGTLTAGCESAAEKAAEKQLESSQRQVQCTASTKAVTVPPGVPSGLPMPPNAVLFHVDDRGKDGLVLSAVASAPFKDVLAAMNGGYSANGFKITSGETEKHDGEANWTTDGHRGRWAIREISSQCPGDTLVTILVSEN